MKIRIRNMLLTILMITLLIIPTNQTLAEKNETNNLYESWHIDNVKFYTNDNERVCLYDSNDNIFTYSVNDGLLTWEEKTKGSIFLYSFYDHYCISENKLIFSYNDEAKTFSWINLEGDRQTVKLGKPIFVRSFNDYIIITEQSEVWLESSSKDRIYNVETGKLLFTFPQESINQNIFFYQNNVAYSISRYSISAISNDETIWENFAREWDDPEDPEMWYQERYDISYSSNDKYFFIYSIYYYGCCLYHDYTINVIDKETGKTVKDIKENVAANFIIDDNKLLYTKGHDNDTPTERWRKVYDRQGHTNTLHKMNTDTFEDDWTLNSEEYNYIITKREQVVDGKLYIMLYDDCKYDEPLVHNKMQCIDVETGKILATYKFEDNVENFGFTEKYLLIETKDGVTCYAFNKEDLPPEEEPTQEISLKFQIGEKNYKLNGEDVIIDATPVILNGRTLLPARYVCEPLGGGVSWDATEKKVVCSLGETIVELWIGKSTAKVNGIEVQIDPDNSNVVPTIINDRTMVPMRFLAESLGCEVEWLADTKEIILTYTP